MSLILMETVFFHLCVVNGSRVGRTHLETLLPNMTEFTLRLLERSTHYKFYLSALTQVGAGEVFAEELPHFANEGEHFFSSLLTVSVELHINGEMIVNDLWVMVNLHKGLNIITVDVNLSKHPAPSSASDTGECGVSWVRELSHKEVLQSEAFLLCQIKCSWSITVELSVLPLTPVCPVSFFVGRECY